MRFPFLSFFKESPLNGIQEHVEKVKECAWAFQQAVECYASESCESFEAHKEEVAGIENEADTIKQKIRKDMTKRFFMTVKKFQMFTYLSEQDKVLGAIEDTLEWLSHRTDLGIPKSIEKEFFLLVDLVIDPVEVLSEIVIGAKKYFKKKSGKTRAAIKEMISELRQKENEADKAEERLKQKIFSQNTDPITVFHMVKLAEMTGAIADHAQNAGDMMGAMVVR
jgi:predicted phosphate transport protein (TIGR00153 family)